MRVRQQEEQMPYNEASLESLSTHLVKCSDFVQTYHGNDEDRTNSGNQLRLLKV